ncbi:ABC transporter ATP-binding protein [Opitutus sp. ER46]|uniref:ABC transporter ATP-binding protein n=1 Tax=Opitutus sp. ER46 TaxID=2161864 RepID=UPI000D3202FA|nr:ABC transporter ATP-binding protein [Opitutus sp. ER46]PTY01153.1 ABC transporter ATP-binding protein [Opitutus sp. ER46]
MPARSTTTIAPPSNWALVRRLFGLAWRYRGHCVQVLVIQLVLLTLGIVGLSFTGLGIDYIRHKVQDVPLGPNRLHLSLPEDWPAFRVLLLLAGLILALALCRAVLNYVYAVSVNRLVQQKLVVDLRAEVYDKLQRLSFRFFDANTTGSIITRITSDVQAVRMFVDQVLIQSVIMGVSLTVYVIYMIGLSPGLTIACLATTPLLWLMSAWFSRQVQPQMAHNRTLVERMVQVLSESIQGVGVTKAFGREAERREVFDQANRACLEQQHAIFWRMSLFSPAVGFLTRINMMVLLGYGGWLVAHDQLPLGTGLVVFAGLLEQFSGQVNNVAAIVNSVQQSLIGARRVFEILDAPIEVRNAPAPVRRPRLEGAVRFENVSFAYDGAEAVVRDIDLDVRPGQCVAILGATGAGKSVLMSLIPRFYDPTAGRILLDGVDARQLHLDDLRRNIGLVFQESFLFSNTIAANIAFGHPEATREQIERAARIAAAHEFIQRLPQGYDTILGESGNSLSGGQRQRLAIARAVLLEPAILLLDDPTAAIDSATEHEIFEALDRAIAGRTTFIVAHRLSTLRRADFIIVLADGRIVQRGTHEQLMREPGPYLHVANLQLVDSRELQRPN